MWKVETAVPQPLRGDMLTWQNRETPLVIMTARSTGASTVASVSVIAAAYIDTFGRIQETSRTDANTVTSVSVAGTSYKNTFGCTETRHSSANTVTSASSITAAYAYTFGVMR